jgi:hypothetical protein
LSSTGTPGGVLGEGAGKLVFSFEQPVNFTAVVIRNHACLTPAPYPSFNCAGDAPLVEGLAGCLGAGERCDNGKEILWQRLGVAARTCSGSRDVFPFCK